MKLVLTLAILAFAAHAATQMNSTDYCLGFAKEANFTDIQIQDCVTCLQSNNSIDWTLDSEFSLSDINPNVRVKALFHAVYPKGIPKDECMPHVINLQIIYSRGKLASGFLKALEVNMDKRFVMFTLDFGDWRVEALMGNGYKFGNQEARLLGYASGLYDDRPIDEGWETSS